MPTRRQHRINEALFEELSLLVPGRLDDPRLVGVQVTRVETTRDLATAKVYITHASPDDAPVDSVLGALARAEGVLRTELAAVGLRRLPRLVFARDKLFESGERVLRAIDRLHDAPADAVADAPGDPPDGVAPVPPGSTDAGDAPAC